MSDEPDLSQYAAAVQVPASVFGDARLKAAITATDPRGLPIANSGGFAIAFRLESSGTAWAVRCFFRPTTGLAERYEHVSKFTRGNSMPFLVPIDYLRQGIRVKGGWWPITVMPWVEGPNLNRWVSDHLHDSRALAAMASSLASVSEAMHRLGSAHGDLQHGNIIVGVGNQPYLVDYDGMFVPDLAGKPMPEGGHPNYQHPERGKLHFGPELDRYSACVIWSALKVLEVRPELWSRFDTGENLLFTAKDFSDPWGSELLRLLEGDSATKSIAEKIRRIAVVPASAVPTLGDFVAGRLPPEPQKPAPPRPSSAAYPVVDVRRTVAPGALSGRVIVVGQIIGKKAGTTVLGAPYLFMDIGGGSTVRLKVVIWEEVLSRFSVLQRQQLRPGTLVTVTGLVTSWEGRPQIVLERPALIDIPSGAQVRDLLGGAGSPLRAVGVGDTIMHDSFGQGIVQEVQGTQASIRFGGMTKRIDFRSYPLTVIRRGAPKTPSPPQPAVPSPAPHAVRLKSQFDQDMDAWMQIAQPQPGHTTPGRPTTRQKRRAPSGHLGARPSPHRNMPPAPVVRPVITRDGISPVWIAIGLIAAGILAAILVSLH